MKFSIHILSVMSILLLVSACEIEGVESDNTPRQDFNGQNYVLACEDASNSDITRFFCFEMSEVIGNTQPYELLSENSLFTNSDPSTSAGHHQIGSTFFAMAKDKKGKSSTPGVYRLTLNRSNRVIINQSLNLRMNNLFPSRKLCIVNKELGFFYNEGLMPHSIYSFNPGEMTVGRAIDLKEAIEAYRPGVTWFDESRNNMVRTGSLSLDEKEGKLYVSIAFLQTAAFNIIADDETDFHLAVVDIATGKVDKIITYPETRTVGFFVSENNPTSKDRQGNLYFCSWGWNQYGKSTPSKIFRIKAGETDFDTNWEFNIDNVFGQGRIAQSMISYNNKIYLHVSKNKYGFEDDDSGKSSKIELDYYEFDPADMSYRKLDIPTSNPSSRMNVFSIIDDKLYVCVANSANGKFNGIYSVDADGKVNQEIAVLNKYRPVRLYQLNN